MSSAWNWIGIFCWLIFIALILGTIANVHSRKKRLIKTALSNRHHQDSSTISARNFEITAIEVIILLILGLGLFRITFRHAPNSRNSIVMSQTQLITRTHTKISPKHPNRKLQHYYVKIKGTKSRGLNQKYFYTTKGEYLKADSNNTILTTSKRVQDINVPVQVKKVLQKHLKKLNHHRAWNFQVITVYKNNLRNGLGLHAGERVKFFNILKVPNRSGIYVKKHHKLVRLNLN